MVKSGIRKREVHTLGRLLLACAHILLIVALLLPTSVANADDPVTTPTPDKEVPPPPPPKREPLAPVESSEPLEQPSQAPDGKVNVIIYLNAQPMHEVAGRVRAEFEPSLEHLRHQIQEIHAAAAPPVPEGGWATKEEERAAYQATMGTQRQEGQSEGERIPSPVGGNLTAEQRAQAGELSTEMETTVRAMRREIVRRARPEVDASQAELIRWLESVGAVIQSRLTIVNAVAATVPQEQLDALRARPDVAEVAENRLMTSHLNVSHHAIDQNTWEDNGYDGGIWDLGVLDSGVDTAHPRLDHLSWSSRVCLAAAGNPSWDNTSDDVNGHGTHVAGIVVNNDATYWGMAWGTDLAHNLKAAYDLNGSDGGLASMYWSDMMDCTDWSLTTASDDADVFNLSYGGCWSSMPDDTSAARFWDAVVSDMYTPATISAGNYDPGQSCTRYVGDPAIAYNILAVANVDDRDTASASAPQRADDVINSSSSWGPSPGGRKKPDIGAPGTDIWSTNNNWEGTINDWVEYSGTSMAAPHVAGALLLLENYGIYSPLVQKAILISTAEDKGSAGWDYQYGWGYMDLGHAWLHRDDWFSGAISPRPDYRLYKGPGYNGDTAALVWNRRVVYAGDSYPSTHYVLSDLDLYMYSEADNSSIDSDTSIIDNVHAVECDSTYSTVVIKVDAYSSSFAGASTESYALATEELFSAASGPVFALGTSSYSRCVGDQWTVNVSVNNTGDLAAHGVSVSLSVPAGLSIVSGSNPQNVGIIADGANSTASWTLRADQAGSYSVPVDVSSYSYGESFSGSGSFSVSVSAVPSTPSLSSPSNGSSTCDTTPYFDWSSVSGATSYRIQVDNNSSFSSPEVDTTTSSSSYTPGSSLSPGTYYWHVRASNSCDDGPWSSTWSFTIDSAPSSAPSLSSPSNGSSTCDTTPYFDWSSVSEATSYRIQVDNNSSFSSPEVDTTTSSSDYTPGSSLSPGTYYWRVRASNSCGEGSWSSTWSFTILSTPSAPLLSAPSNGSSTCDNTPTFSWNSVSGATSYNVQVSTSSSFSTLEIDQATSGTSYTPSSSLPAGTHYWRVRASNSCGYGSWSSIWSFTIISTPPVPSLSSPGNGSHTCDTTPDFDWSSVSGSTSYRIQVDNNSSFSSPEVDTTTSSSDYTPGSSLSPGTYYWRVRASNSCGDGSWSSTWSFTIDSAPSSAPILSSPSNGSSTCDTTPYFDWSSVSGATSYRIQVDNNSSFSSPEINTTTSSSNYTPGSPLSPGTYYWRVRASNSCGDSPWSSTWGFTVLSTPSAPSLSSPSNGSSTCDNTPTFNWSSVSGAVSYDIQVSTSSSFSSLEINQTTSNTSYTPPTPLSAGTHYWRVRTNAACGSGDWSSIWSVTIMEIPSPPTLSSPPNGSNTCDTTPTICWSSVTGATSYRLQVSSSSAFGSPIIDESGLSSTCYTPSSALSPGPYYYWRVNGANTCGTSAWSSAGNFAVIAIPASPTLSSPADNGQVADRAPTFMWNAATWASSYRIQVSTSSSFATLLVDQTTSDTSYTAVSEFSLGTYYWRVRASNACGTGSWSPTRSFEVIEALKIFLPAVMKNY